MGITGLQLCFIFFVANSFAVWPGNTAFPNPFADCVDYVSLRKVSDSQTNPCGLIWHDQNKEQIQDVYKRFLFHYSKSQDSLHSVQRESHLVHPLMRLSPKLSQRKKKRIFLKKMKMAGCDPSATVDTVIRCSFKKCNINFTTVRRPGRASQYPPALCV